MKKIYLLSILICLFFMTGCTKNYKTVGEYITAMEAEKAKNPAYTLEARIQSKEPGKTLEQYHRSFIKDNKWKTDISTDNGSTYASSILNTGSKILIYSDDSEYAMKSPLESMLKNADAQMKQTLNLIHNPIITLINWNENLSPEEIDSLTFVNNEDYKNNFKCRLISDGKDFEVCVNDKLGIAVYEKITIERRTSSRAKQNAEIIIDLIKADTNDLPDETFQLPEGKKEISFEDIMKDLSKSFEKLSKERKK